jgi:hypothetical protein
MRMRDVSSSVGLYRDMISGCSGSSVGVTLATKFLLVHIFLMAQQSTNLWEIFL